jgi:hypothetical protein
MHPSLRHPLAALLVGLLAACQTGDEDTEDTDADTDIAVSVAGSCAYVNTFSKADECKEYVGAGWTTETATADCAAPLVGADPGTFTDGVACDDSAILGKCRVNAGNDDEYAIVSPGTNADDCSGAALGCGFANGTFEPSPLCDGTSGGGGGGGGVFVPFEQTCQDPLPGEPVGASEGGQVCTWGAISACTEEGRNFSEYASCDAVLSQRPYYGADIPYDTPANDPRLSDSAYMGEMDWVTDQVKACACLCCHSSTLPPEGPSGWNIDAGPLWIDMLDDDGLAVLAGWVDSTAFGAFPPEDNNGFDRSTTGLPTNDIPRMLAFLESELARRGLERTDFANTDPFGGPLYDQLVYEPSPCTAGEGVAADGTVTWNGGPVRYLYVLTADASAPGVPPNLDTPAGTLWRLDVAPTDDAVASPLTYGTVPAGMTQKVPASGAPPTLVSGTTYYLYALKDIYQPLTRCLFVAP